MFYAAIISREGEHLLVDFPDAPGCQTFADSEEDLRIAAKEALEGWLEAHLVNGRVPPRPRKPPQHAVWGVLVRPGLAAAIQLRWARQDAGLSQKQLAERAQVSQQQIAKLEDPDENPTLATLEKAFAALGVQMDLETVPMRAAVG